MRPAAKQVAAELCIPMAEGVYAAMLGPSYETPAEIRFLRTIGADVVGMSTVFEVIAANHMGMKSLAISCVTNMAAGILPQKINHEEVLETGAIVRETLVRFLKALVPQLAAEASLARSLLCHPRCSFGKPCCINTTHPLEWSISRSKITLYLPPSRSRLKHLVI